MMYGMEMKVKTVQLWYMACILIELLRQKPGTNDTDKYIFVKHRSSRFILARMFRMSNYYSSIADDVINNNPLIVKNPLQ